MQKRGRWEAIEDNSPITTSIYCGLLQSYLKDIGMLLMHSAFELRTFQEQGMNGMRFRGGEKYKCDEAHDGIEHDGFSLLLLTINTSEVYITSVLCTYHALKV